MADKLCPLLKKACAEHACRWYIQMLGKHPQKDAPVPEWGCAVEWLPVLLVENAQQTRQAGAAIESFRNEAVKNTQAIAVGVLAVSRALPHPEKDVSGA